MKMGQSEQCEQAIKLLQEFRTATTEFFMWQLPNKDYDAIEILRIRALNVIHGVK